MNLTVYVKDEKNNYHRDNNSTGFSLAPHQFD